MKDKKLLKKLLIPAAVVLVIAAGLGIWYATAQSNTEPVNVYPFNYLGMTEYWGDSQESYGPVTTDRIQTIYLSDTQTVTEIAVSAGDTVKKGDLLMTFDTTLSDLALERKRLDVEKLKLQLEDAKTDLIRINTMEPMVIPDFDASEEEEDENLGTALKGSCQISTKTAYDGSEQSKALICWIGTNTAIDNNLLEAIRQMAEGYQEQNAKLNYIENNLSSGDRGYTVILLSDQNPTDSTEEAQESTEETEESTESTEETDESTESTGETEESTESTEETDESTEETDESTESTEETEESTEPTIPDIDLTVNSYYVVFKMTQKDMSLGQTTLWQGLIVTGNADSGFTFRFFDASGVPDHMLADSESGGSADTPQIDFGSGYTAAQIAQMRSEQEKKIKDLQFQIKMAEADYKIMQTEVSDGSIYAEIDGEVVSVLTEDEARLNNQPVLKLSGGGGFYVEGTVSELEKDNLQIGQEVTVNDWSTGMTYTGTIDSLGDFPSSDGYFTGMGNPNASYYPFTVFVDGSADLQAGNYVSVMYSSATAENGIYLQNPFLRTENGSSYVYVLGSGGKLEKRSVTTGKALWGSYTEILEGLSAEDYIAFPYGKDVKHGAAAVECDDMSKLYE